MLSGVISILLAALITIFPTSTLQISTKSNAQFLSNSCLKNGTQKQKFPIWKMLISLHTSLSNRTMLQLKELVTLWSFCLTVAVAAQ